MHKVAVYFSDRGNRFPMDVYNHTEMSGGLMVVTLPVRP